MSDRLLVLSGCKHRGYCSSERRLDGKTVVITGANNGIGKVTAQHLWHRGADVTMVCRDERRGKAALDELKAEVGPGAKTGKLRLVIMDLASLGSVRRGAAEIRATHPKIHILINNAGIMATPYHLSEDGFELQFATNHLGHFLFTMLLLPTILESTPARIVNLSSVAHTFYMKLDVLNDKDEYYSVFAYFRSKAANVMFSRELAKRLRGRGVNVYALNPGYIDTGLYRHSSKTFFPGFAFIVHHILSCYIKDPWEGAQTTIHCALCESVEEETGLYYDECQVTKINKMCRDDELCALLWDKSVQWTGLEGGELPASGPASSPSSTTSTSPNLTVIAQ